MTSGWVKAMIGEYETAKVHWVWVENEEMMIGDAETLCGLETAANRIHETGWDVSCKRCKIKWERQKGTVLAGPLGILKELTRV